MTTYNDKKKIREHYDLVSPYYRALWGEHLHHGYWISGKETKEKAQLQLTEHLAEVAGIKQRSSVLDIGCGFGASSIYLAKMYGAKTTGITISSVQVDIAKKAAEAEHVGSEFLLMDAEKMEFGKTFDVVWSIESISHYKNKEKFFERAAELLKPGGVMAIIDWFKLEDLPEGQYKKYILPIEKGMLVKLETMADYKNIMRTNGLNVVKTENLNRYCSKTWDISLEIIKNKTFWRMALKNGSDFIKFLRSFQAMKSGFSSGKFVYGLIVAKK